MGEQGLRGVVPFGDGAVRFELPPGIARRALLDALLALPGVEDAVVTERHACVFFDPRGEVPVLAEAIAAARQAETAAATVEHVIAVRYDGPDLERVAAWAGLQVKEVIERHLARSYTVEVVGFLPGFAYLGEVDPAIAAPRLPAPRVRVPPGSVGIAGARTGIYPFASPGGWNLIGTAIGETLFDSASGARLRLGDRVRFVRG